MYKYRTFFFLFCCFILLLLWNHFPITFDNNDDQAMWCISAGIFTTEPSSYLVLSHVFLGKIISLFSAQIPEINSYTLFLEIVLLLCFFGIFYLTTIPKGISIYKEAAFALLFVLGFLALLVTKIQFTSVALICVGTALLGLQSNFKYWHKLLFCLFFIVIAFLIRRESFYILLAFAFPILILQQKKHRKWTIAILLLSTSSFLLCWWMNDNNPIYQQQNTYSKVNIIDMLAAHPIEPQKEKLQNNNFSLDDLTLIQSWFIADNHYIDSAADYTMAKQLRTHRSISQTILELIKCIRGEYYSILFFIISACTAWIFNPQKRWFIGLNAVLLVFLFSFLAATSRLPFRVTFPIFTYLNLVHLWCILESDRQHLLKRIAILTLCLMAVFKFYSTIHHFSTKKEKILLFEKYVQEINQHPDYLFIALDDFPIQYMDAWTPSKNFLQHKNVILNGWYAATPNYAEVLKTQGLNNLTSDLLHKKSVVFLTQNEQLLQHYRRVMQQRYGIACHFEKVTKGFAIIQPNLLVFD